MYSQLGSKSRPLLVVQRITCTSFDTIFQYNYICTYMYQFWYCFQYKYMVQNIIFWPVYSQLGSKSRPLLVRNFGLCTSQIVVYDPKLRYMFIRNPGIVMKGTSKYHIPVRLCKPYLLNLSECIRSPVLYIFKCIGLLFSRLKLRGGPRQNKNLAGGLSGRS